MFVGVVVVLLGTAFSAELDPSLTEWRLLKTDFEKVKFPLRDYILEVKAFRPDTYNTNPSYGERFAVWKLTTMMMILHAGNWNKQAGRVTWNTIKYDEGRDIAIEECDARYEAYYSWPANGEKEQIWAWNFFEDHVELTCDDDMQYQQRWDEGEKHRDKPGLPEKCAALGAVDVDRITFRHMAGEYIRARPKVVKEPEPTTPPKPTTQPEATTQPEPSTEPAPVTVSKDHESPDDNKLATTQPKATTQPQATTRGALIEEHRTCDCWTKECNYCANMECTVQHDLINGYEGIAVQSKLGWRILNSIVLYDEDGNTLGMFQWNLKKILLTGCVNCQSPPAIRSITPGNDEFWYFNMDSIDGVLTLTLGIGGHTLYTNTLKGECADRYSKIGRFAFFDMACENTFSYSRENMVAGARITPDCAGACPLM